MKETEPREIGKSLEHITTLEEVLSIFKKLTDREYKEVRKIKDEKGLYLFDITIPGEIEGEIIEYSYRRGQTKLDKHLVDAIQIVYHENNIPISGTNVAEIVDGKWKIL